MVVGLGGIAVVWVRIEVDWTGIVGVGIVVACRAGCFDLDTLINSLLFACKEI